MGGGEKQASVPQPQRDVQGERNRLKADIMADKELDEESRLELSTSLDDNKLDPTSVYAKYREALDPENPQTKERKKRAAQKEIAKDQPGLKSQTTFLGAGTNKSSYLGGGNR